MRESGQNRGLKPRETRAKDKMIHQKKMRFLEG